MHLLFALSIVTAALGTVPNGEPAHQPQLAVNGATVALTYGAGHAIYFSRSVDGGKSFAPAVQVAESPVLLLTRHRGPRVAFAGDAIVITAVTGKGGTTAGGAPSYAADLMAWRSSDGGKTWSQAVTINDAPGSSPEALHGLASDPKGRLFSVWLDNRAGKQRLYGALSTDAGRTWSKNTLVYASPDGTICECCHPSAAFDSAGNITVMFRNWLGGSRDLYLAQSKDGANFSRPRKLGEGTWKLNGCPMDGGGLAAGAGGIVTAWRREHSIFLDRPGEPEREIGAGTDVAIAAGAGGVYAIWSTPESIEMMAPGETKGRAIGAKGTFPAVAALAGGAVAAWENAGKIVVGRVR
ncbi:MAG TPA: sialidase family protein [Bryobacteraceae bacterium]|jgi:hypothetical protein|nr:sialidase family protein [Bryobacteraceae bacterium]